MFQMVYKKIFLFDRYEERFLVFTLMEEGGTAKMPDL